MIATRVLPLLLVASALPAALAACGARSSLHEGKDAAPSGGSSGQGGAGSEGGASPAGGGGEAPAVTCEPGAPPVELAQIVWPIAMDHDAEALYVASYTERGGLWRVPKDGAAPTLLASMSYASGVALAGDEVVVASSGDREVVRVPKGGGPATRIAGFFGPSDVRVVGADVYVANYLDDEVARVPLAGGEPVVLASGQSGVHRLAIGAGLVVWGSFVDELRGVPLGGGAPFTLAPFAARRIAAQGEDFFFTSNGSSSQPRRIVRAGAGGAFEVLAEDADAGFVEGIAADASHVYYARWSAEEDTIARVPRAGGAVQELAAIDEPLELLVDGTCLYVTAGASEARTGSVVRLGVP
ncbi:MAG: hypothetical protein IPG04_18045 [Polyangiaceae bacterium]|nr:hypothetical protein [Polyangiaceae bacterium]